MQLKLINKNQEKTQYDFLIKGVEPYILNALRRSAISLVPTMAFENIELKKNSSVIYDEMVAHRLGLVPLKTDLKHYEMIKKPEDAESLKCHVKMTLKAKGPKIVYSGDIKSSDPAVVPVYDNMPIAKLAKGQEIELQATAILGVGKDHMKWSPGIIFYKHKPIITVKSNVDVEELKKKIPEESALKITGNKVKVDEDKLMTSHYFDAFAGEVLIDGVDVSMSEDEFVFSVESFGQLSVKEMLTTSVDALQEKLKEFSDLLSKA